MSEELWEEAIKAAHAKGFFPGITGLLEPAFAEGYCSATAKLRDELKPLMAELREELEQTKRRLLQMLDAAKQEGNR